MKAKPAIVALRSCMEFTTIRCVKSAAVDFHFNSTRARGNTPLTLAAMILISHGLAALCKPDSILGKERTYLFTRRLVSIPTM